MSRLEITLLGPPQIIRDGEPLAAPLWNKTVALLAYLAIESDRPHRREELAGLLWPEEPEAAARHSLRQALNQLRQALGGSDQPLLLVTPQALAFNPAWSEAVDVVQFSRAIAACEQHRHRRLEGCRSCVERLAGAVARYRGDLLVGLSVRDSAPFEEWVVLRQEQLRRQVLAALYALAEGDARQGDYARMEQAARRQVAMDPFREQAHRQLLRALAWSGQSSAALAHYAELGQLLRQELDASPEDQTAALIEQVRGGELPPPAAPALHNWPASPAPLVGREAELAALCEFLQSPEARLVTVTGPGGVGKTRLALAAAAGEALSFSDGACFVSLAAVSATEFVVPAIAAALGLSLGSTPDPQSWFRAHLQDKELLLLLDSLEHLRAAAALVAELLAACPGLTVLVTSQEPLHLRAEQQFRLAPLAVPEPARLPAAGAALVAALATVPAVELFVQRARGARPTFTLDEDNAATVAEICTRLDGLPLALELAAAHVDTLALPELLSRLERRLSFLVDGFHDLPPRQRTLRATLDWSYDLLAPGEKELLAQMSVFAGGCAPEAVQEVCPSGASAAQGPDAGLRALLRKSLLQRQEVVQVGPWVTMLETVHEYARERLAERAEQAAFRDRHASYYVALVEQARPYIGGPQGEGWMARLEQERNNLRAALRWALDRADREVALRLGAALWTFWDVQGDYAEGLRWLEAVLEFPSPLEQPAGASPELTLAWIRTLAGAGVLAGELGSYDRAVSRLEEALALCRDVGHLGTTSFVLAWLGWAAGEAGKCERSVASYEECLDLSRARGGLPGRMSEAFCLNGLGNVAAYLGDHAAARAHFEASLAIRRELGDAHGIVCTLYNLGRTIQSMGGHEQARALFREGLALAWESRDDVHVGWDLLALGQVSLALGRPAQAVRLLPHAERLLRLVMKLPGETCNAVYEQVLAAARAALGEEAFLAARAAGEALTLQQAVTEALKDGGGEDGEGQKDKMAG